MTQAQVLDLNTFAQTLPTPPELRPQNPKDEFVNIRAIVSRAARPDYGLEKTLKDVRFRISWLAGAIGRAREIGTERHTRSADALQLRVDAFQSVLDERDQRIAELMKLAKRGGKGRAYRLELEAAAAAIARPVEPFSFRDPVWRAADLTRELTDSVRRNGWQEPMGAGRMEPCAAVSVANHQAANPEGASYWAAFEASSSCEREGLQAAFDYRWQRYEAVARGADALEARKREEREKARQERQAAAELEKRRARINQLMSTPEGLATLEHLVVGRADV